MSSPRRYRVFQSIVAIRQVLECVRYAPLFSEDNTTIASGCTPARRPTNESANLLRDFGATGNGATNDTPAINQAIEKCNASGGSDVVFPAGTYLAASIHLKNNIRLVLDKDAVITGAASGYDTPEPNCSPLQPDSK